MQGESRTTKILLRLIGEEKRKEIDNFASESSNRLFYEIKNQNQLTQLFKNITMQFKDHLTFDDLMIIRSYTGYQFKNINAILRNNWSYEECGLLTDEIKNKYQKLAQEIERLVNKFPSLEMDVSTYRGVELNSLKKYGIKNLKELEILKDKYMYEEGFTSTSIIRNNSYFGQNLENSKNYNIEIKYLIPKESKDGALLIEDNLSFSPGQTEYLINKGSLAKIIDVKINIETNQAQLTALLIPKKLWNINEKKEIEKREYK